MTDLNDSAASLPPDEPPTILYIGQHESQRNEPVTEELLSRAQSAGYDVLTAPITTSAFQSRVLQILDDHVKKLQAASSEQDVPLPLLPALSSVDTNLSPADANSSLIAVVSPWIDLASSDPLMAHISRQVFSLEVAYAAFVGVSNVLVTGPLSSKGTVAFARALLEGLGLGPYLQLHVLMPMTGELEQDVSADGTHLGELARPQYANLDEESLDEDGDAEDLYGSWDVWNTVRTVCNHSNKLSIGTQSNSDLSSSFPISSSSLLLSLSASSSCSH